MNRIKNSVFKIGTAPKEKKNEILLSRRLVKKHVSQEQSVQTPTTTQSNKPFNAASGQFKPKILLTGRGGKRR